MPTLRTFWFLVAGFLLYLFANQTQVGWLYVMSAILIGLVIVGFLLNRTMTKDLHAARIIGAGLESEYYENDGVQVQLLIHNQHARQCINSHPVKIVHSLPLMMTYITSQFSSRVSKGVTRLRLPTTSRFTAGEYINLRI